MSTPLRYVGGSHTVADASAKVTGELAFGSDLRLPGLLHAKLLLSPIAHGIVTRIHTSAAEAVPGVVAVVSHRNSLSRPFCRSRIMPAQELCPEDETLFSEHVRFVGDRVAAVVATSLAAAEEAVALIDVEYRDLPHVFTPELALEQTPIPIHSGGNLLYEHELEFGAAPPPKPDDVILTSTTHTPRVHHAALEPHVATASWDGDALTIWTTSQGVYGVMTVVGDLFGLDYRRIRVIKLPTGGSFGGKTEFMLEPVVTALAMETGRPVQLRFDRRESMIATMTRPRTTSTIRSVTGPDGLLRDLAVASGLDAGAYASSTPDYSVHMCKKIPKLYRLPHYHHRCQVVYTNTPVAGAARGWGAPEIITAMEIHMDGVAAALGVDPVDLRLRNLVEPFDIDHSQKLSLGDARVRECLERGALAFGWEARRAAVRRDGRLRRGVGVACGAHKNGMYGGFDAVEHGDVEGLADAFAESSTMSLRLDEDGGFTLSASLHDQGCGVVTVMKVIVAEVMGVSPDLVRAAEADTDHTPYDYGTFGSRATYVCGACAKAVATELRGQMLWAAAIVLGVPAERLVAADGEIRVGGEHGRRVGYADLAAAAVARGGLSAVTQYFASSNPGSYSVQFAEVEVDTATGLVRVTDLLAAVDIGQSINTGMVQAQVQGAVQMGIGYALCERLEVDERGRCATAGLKEYHIVNAPDMPDVHVLLVEHNGDDGPFGAKSVGEIAVVPTAAAVVNAVNHALGTSLSDLPLTPEKIVAAVGVPGLV